MLGLHLREYQLVSSGDAYSSSYKVDPRHLREVMRAENVRGACLGLQGAVPGVGTFRAKRHNENRSSDMVWRVAVGLARESMHLQRSAWRSCYHGLVTTDTKEGEPWLVLHAGSMIVDSQLVSSPGVSAPEQQSRLSDTSDRAASVVVQTSPLAVRVHGMGTLALMSLSDGSALTIPLQPQDLPTSEHAFRMPTNETGKFAATVLFDVRVEHKLDLNSTHPTSKLVIPQGISVNNGVGARNHIEARLQGGRLDVAWMGTSLLPTPIPVPSGVWLSVALCITVTPARSQGVNWSVVTATVYIGGHLVSPPLNDMEPARVDSGAPWHLSLHMLANETGDPLTAISSEKPEAPHLQDRNTDNTSTAAGVGELFIGRVVVTRGLLSPQGIARSHRYLTLLQELRHASVMSASANSTSTNPSVSGAQSIQSSWMPPPVSSTDGVVSVHAISLGATVGRWKVLEAAGRAQNITITRWLAADARNMTWEQAREVNVSEAVYTHVRKNQKLGAFGCLLSHRALLSHLAGTPAPPDAIHWVFEDDARLPSNLTASWALAHTDLVTFGSDWDMVFLGTVRSNVSAVPGLQVLMRPLQGRKANEVSHAYAVRHGSLPHVLSLLHDVTTPIDVLLLRETYAGNLRRFDVPHLVQQLSFLRKAPSYTNPKRNRKTYPS